jgi:NAD(P)H-dependent FMN reductase
MKLLALSGSLRRASLNSALLRAAARLAPNHIEVCVFEAMAALPLFNPDREFLVPDPVSQLRAEVAASDAILVASPEYAHGISGVMKNALDWLVSFEPFVNKPIAVLNASPRAHHADDALREVLRTMSADVVAEACATLPLLGSGLDEEGILRSAAIRETLASVFRALETAVARASADPHFPAP